MSAIASTPSEVLPEGFWDGTTHAGGDMACGATRADRTRLLCQAVGVDALAGAPTCQELELR